MAKQPRIMHVTATWDTTKQTTCSRDFVIGAYDKNSAEDIAKNHIARQLPNNIVRNLTLRVRDLGAPIAPYTYYSSDMHENDDTTVDTPVSEQVVISEETKMSAMQTQDIIEAINEKTSMLLNHLEASNHAILNALQELSSQSIAIGQTTLPDDESEDSSESNDATVESDFETTEMECIEDGTSNIKTESKNTEESIDEVPSEPAPTECDYVNDLASSFIHKNFWKEEPYSSHNPNAIGNGVILNYLYKNMAFVLSELEQANFCTDMIEHANGTSPKDYCINAMSIIDTEIKMENLTADEASRKRLGYIQSFLFLCVTPEGEIFYESIMCKALDMYYAEQKKTS